MARMIPHTISPDMRTKYKVPDSEIRVFEELSKLPDEYVCVWSVPWADNELRHRTGEVDFLIIHPKFPLTVLEVKGGKLSCQHGKWSRLIGANPEVADSPIDQAYKNREVLVQKILRMPGIQSKDFMPSAAVVVLTDTSRASLVGDPAFYHFVLTIEDFGNFRERLEKTMATPTQNLNRFGTGIGQTRVDFLQKMFSVIPSFQVPLRSLMELDNALIERLSVDHYLTLNQLAAEKKVMINGGAGTGKTVLAVQKAIREAQAGRKTLLVCYNEILAASLAKQVATCTTQIKNNLVALTYHQLCKEICKTTNEIPAGEKEKPTEYFSELEFNAEYIALHEENAQRKFDSIVVDEGQDFKESWWNVLEVMQTENPEGHFWIFKDDFQNVQHGGNFPLQGFFNFHLLKNFRNSREVFKLIKNSKLSRFIDGTVAVGPSGAECQVIAALSPDDLRNKLAAKIKKLIEVEKIPASEIVILTGKSLENRENILCGQTRLNGIPLTRSPQAGKSEVMVETVRKYKGLENKFVLLLEVDESDEAKFERNEQLVYVGASRAMTALTIFARQATLERLGFLELDPIQQTA